MKTRWVFVVGSVAFALGLAVPGARAQNKMYWAGSGGIARANVDGSDVEVLVPSLLSPKDIALDVAGGKIYWTDAATDKIQRANLDGTQVEDLVTGVESFGIALDLESGKMYWTARLEGKMQRANLEIPTGQTPDNRTDIEDLVTGLSGPRGIALDLQAGTVYWTIPFSGKIQRAGVDGSNVEDLVVISETQLVPVGIALDVPAGKMYWTLADIVWGETPGKIQRANLDGSGIEDIVTQGAFTNPRGIALDIRAEKLYWTDPQVGKIQRANLDGSGVEDLVEVFEPTGIALDLSRGAIPTVSKWGLIVMVLLMLMVGAVLIERRVATRRAL